jgi:hypothetical protein
VPAVWVQGENGEKRANARKKEREKEKKMAWMFRPTTGDGRRRTKKDGITSFSSAKRSFICGRFEL